jgi:GMP synthase (glutamine-hydrolysing)
MTAVIACLRHEPPDALGAGEAAIAGEGVALRYVDLWRGERCPDAGGLDGIISLGGTMNADQTERFPFLAEEREVLRACVEAGVPVLGICLGGQVLARALGAPVAAGTSRELGFLPLHVTEAWARDPILTAFAEGDVVFRWHEDGFDLPAPAELVLAGDEPAPCQAFRVGAACWGLQFHPELTMELLLRWLDLAGAHLAEAWGTGPDRVVEEARRHLPGQERRSAEMFRRFARLVAGG